MIIVQSGPSEDPSGKTLKIRMWLRCVKCMLWNQPTNLLGWQDTYATADILLHETLQLFSRGESVVESLHVMSRVPRVDNVEQSHWPGGRRKPKEHATVERKTGACVSPVQSHAYVSAYYRRTCTGNALIKQNYVHENSIQCGRIWPSWTVLAYINQTFVPL